MSWGPTKGQAFRRLTEAQVRELRKRWWGGASSVALGREFGIGKATVLGIVRGTNYRHVPGWFTPEERQYRNAWCGVNG